MEQSWSVGIWPLDQPPQAPLTGADPLPGAGGGALQVAGIPVLGTGSGAGATGGAVARAAWLGSGPSRTATCQRSAEADSTLVPPRNSPTSSRPVRASVLNTRSPTCSWPACTGVPRAHCSARSLVRPIPASVHAVAVNPPQL